MRYALLVLLTASCVVGDSDDDDADLVDPSATSSFALRPGVNGAECIASPFNCRFRDGDPRVTTAGNSELWAILPGAAILDGNGHSMTDETGATMTFNYGQTRTLAGKPHALALSTSNDSAGWYPFDHVADEDSFRARVGNVDAKDPGEGRLGCYQIRDAADETLVVKKVVKGATGTNERAGDYLPLVRADGRRSANLVFSVPGFALGGATTDHFPQGTKFRRLSVKTDSGLPSISIPLWKETAPNTKDGTIRFLYGVIRADDGTHRYGWMAQPALEVSTGCD